MAVPIVPSPEVGIAQPQGFNLREFALGRPGEFQQVPTYTPNQTNAINQILGYTLPQVTGQNSAFNFAPIAQNIRKNFYEDTLPSIATRFAALDGAGSSGYRNTLKKAGSDLESQIGSLESNYNLQRQSQLLSLLGMGLTPQFSTQHIEGTPGAAQAVAPYVGQALGQAIPGVVGAGVDLLRGGAQALGQKIFGGGNQQPQATQGTQLADLAQQINQPNVGIQAIREAGKGLAAGAAPVVGAKAAAAALGPKAAAAVGGLTPFGSWFIPIAAGVALTAAGYFAYNALRNKWEKQKELTPQEKKLAAQLNTQYPVVQQGNVNPPKQGQAPQITCQNGVCNFGGNRQQLYAGTLQQQIDAGLRPASDAFPNQGV